MAGFPRPAPFIVGVGRSGTTLLRLMLDCHPEIAIPPETHFIPALPIGQSCSSDAFFDALMSYSPWADFQLDKEMLRSALNSLSPFSVTDGLRCFYRLYAERFGKPLWGDKTPLYSLHMTRIQTLLPEARFIHIIRDGRDVALSYKGLWFGPGENVSDQAEFWVERISSARKQAESLSHYLEVRFEELVADPVDTLRLVTRFLDVPYSERMLSYYQEAASRLAELSDRRHPDGSVVVGRERRISIFDRAMGPPDSSRVGLWQSQMPDQQQEKFERRAGPMLHALGYRTRFRRTWPG